MRTLFVAYIVVMFSSCTTPRSGSTSDFNLLESNESVLVILDTFYAYPIQSHAIGYDVNFNTLADGYIRKKLSNEFDKRGLTYQFFGNLHGLTVRPTINKKVFFSQNWQWENTTYDSLDHQSKNLGSLNPEQFRAELLRLLDLARKGQFPEFDSENNKSVSDGASISEFISGLNEKHAVSRIMFVRAHGSVSKGVRVSPQGGLIDGRSARLQGSDSPFFITEVMTLNIPEARVDWYFRYFKNGHRNFSRGIDYALKKLFHEK